MEVTQTLYDWYVEKWEQDEVIAKPARETLNYVGSDIVTKPISKAEFIRWLRFASHNPRVKQMWINGFTCRHETAIAKLPDSVRRFLDDCANNPATFLDESDVELRDAS